MEDNATLKKNTALSLLVKKTVLETFQGILNDPDFGLPLRKGVQERLTKRPQKLISLKEIRQKHQ